LKPWEFKIEGRDGERERRRKGETEKGRDGEREKGRKNISQKHPVSERRQGIFLNFCLL